VKEGTILGMETFTDVVPIGASCRNTHNVRSHFGSATGYPFDWYVSPLPGVIEAITSGLDPDSVFADDNLIPTLGADGRISAIVNARYGFEHVHDFPSASGAYRSDWRSLIGRAKARFAHAVSNLRALNAAGKRILFVRHVRNAREGDTPECVARLQTGLAASFPDARIRVALVNAPFTAADTIPVRVTESRERVLDWTGDHDAWRRGFAEAGLMPFDNLQA
jgi:hypothetical protein